VDIWVPEFNAVWLDEYYEKGAIRKQLAAGNRVWSYAALAYVPSEWDRAHPFSRSLVDSHPPKWLIDYAPINYRIPTWLNALVGITGLLALLGHHLVGAGCGRVAGCRQLPPRRSE